VSVGTTRALSAAVKDSAKSPSSRAWTTYSTTGEPRQTDGDASAMAVSAGELGSGENARLDD
jgi:hypothetical protein